MKRPPGSRFHEPSLVPLADMLANTVGIILFILIFTVLTAGGVMIAKRLPIERSTKKKPLMIVCAGNQIYPMTEVENRFLKPLGDPEKFSIESWLKRFEQQRIEDEFFTLTGEVTEGVTSRSVVLVATPQPGRGESASSIRSQTSAFRRVLKEHSADEWFVYFLVRPDSVDAFAAARAMGTEEFNYSVGWNPLGPKDDLRISLSGTGRKAVIQ
jgi:hypothetical protein